MMAVAWNRLRSSPISGLGAIQRYAPILTAILSVGLALLLRFALEPLLDGRFALMTLLLAVVASAYLAGPWSAFCASILSAIVAVIYFIEPAHRILPIAGRDLIGLITFLLIGLMIAMISGRMSLLQSRAQRTADERARQIVRMAGQLQVSDRLALIGTLTAGLTHDMNNILMPLGARLDAVEDELKQHHIHSEHIEQLRSVARYLGSLSHGVSQLVAQPEQLSETPLRLHEWAKTMDPLLRLCVPRTVTLSLSVPHDLPQVMIAPHALTQAVFNLVNNSCKAIDGRHGHVTLDARHDAEHRTVVLQVRDDGPGMSESVLSRLRECTPQSTETGVHGLGLRVVHSIIKAAHGSVQVRSERGRGTEVRLILPVAESTERATVN